MAKTKISEFSTTPANNTDIDGINIAEGCAPSGINNAIRELMSQLKDQQTGASGDDFTVGGALAVTGAAAFTVTPTAPTATFADDSTKVATTAFVQDAIAEFATDLADTGANGVVVRTAAGVTTAREVTAGTGISISNGTGVDGNPAISIDDAGVTTVKIADANVTTAKIADASITAAKLNGAQSGSAPVYGARAWASFSYNGSAVVITGSGNIASITRTSQGVYEVTFTTQLGDGDYSVVGSSHGSISPSSGNGQTFGVYGRTNLYFGVNITDPTGDSFRDPTLCSFAVFK